MDIFARIESAAHSGAHGLNGIAAPSVKQNAAGNYRLGRANLHGLNIGIETPRGAYRTGKDGKPFSTMMQAHYGHVTGYRGADGDWIDCFIGAWPESGQAWVINQSALGGSFDEHKIMLGFNSEEEARQAYLGSFERGWQGLGSMVPCTVDQLKWWLKNGDTKKEIKATSLPFDGNNAMTTEITWDSEANPVNIDMPSLILAIRKDDADGLALDAVTVADIMEASDGELALDALVVPFAKLERKMGILQVVMKAAGNAVKPVGMQISAPFRQRGTTNVAVVYELSDGQSISVFFHNPDKNPNKILPADDMISWKWLLNKKDVTILVAPERGNDLNVREVARRMMKIAEKNSSRFARANASRAERMANIEAMKQSAAEKEAILTGLESEIMDLAAKVSQKRLGKAPTPELVQPETAPTVAEAEAAEIPEWKRNGFDPTTPEGYAVIAGNDEALDDHQDGLDSFFQGRIIEIRNALRDLGWDAENYKWPMYKSEFKIDVDFKRIGAGANVVGATWAVALKDAINSVGAYSVDDLTKTPAEFAAFIDAKAKPASDPTDVMAAKREQVLAGEAVVMSDKELDDWIKDGMPTNVVSAPNPDQVGILDAWLVGLVTNTRIQEFRKNAGIVEEPATADKSMDDVISVLPILKKFMPASQFSVLGDLIRGEEGQFFKNKLVEVAETIKSMPETYGQDGKGDQAIAYLHYFKGSGDWYITEKDSGSQQIQAFGQADLGMGPELGYISIEELAQNGVELDLYFTPKTLAEINGATSAAEVPSDPVVAADIPAAVVEENVADQKDQAANTGEDAGVVAAKAYLQSIISGATDMLDPEMANTLSDIHDKYKDVADVMAMFNDAAVAYSDFMVKAAKDAMS